MLINLIKFEFLKRWKALKYVLLGYILLQAVLLIASSTFLWDDNITNVFIEENYDLQNVGTPTAITMLIYFFVALLICLYPFFEGITRYDKDLSGRQSVLELMIPTASWKKIVSKLITVLVSTIVCVGLGGLSITAFILISSNFNRVIIDVIMNMLHVAFASPGLLVLEILYIIFGFVSTYMIIYFCIAFSKVFSHKSKIAVPIGIAMFVSIVAIQAFLDDLMFEFPIVKFNLLGEDSLSLLIVNLFVFITALSVTSWLMDYKIDH